VRVHQAETAVLLHELTIPDVVELSFSPRGTYLSIWERHVKLGDGGQHGRLGSSVHYLRTTCHSLCWFRDSSLVAHCRRVSC
jgi:hypothetical protein